MNFRKRKWKRFNNINRKQIEYSYINSLLKENKISKEFILSISSLSLEEIIAIKLEISMKLWGGYLFNIPLWRNVAKIVKKALLIVTSQSSLTEREASSVLGLTKIEYESIEGFDAEVHSKEDLASWKRVPHFRKEINSFDDTNKTWYKYYTDNGIEKTPLK